MPKAPVIPVPPPQYDSRRFEEVFQTLRSYFFALDNPDIYRIGQLFLTNTPTQADFDAGLRSNYVWVDDDGHLRLSGVGTGGAGSGVGLAYDAGGFVPGTPLANMVMTRHVFVRAVDFPANLTDSKASAGVAATAQTDFDLQKNGMSFGTMRFATSATTCTFVGVSATSFVAGDVLTVIAPATPDATLADVAWMFKGVRV